jgi:hypothetical protein
MPLTPPPRVCNERMRLLDELNAATGDYARAATDLACQMGAMPDPLYKIRKAEVEQARQDAEHCRTALIKHREEHGC